MPLGVLPETGALEQPAPAPSARSALRLLDPEGRELPPLVSVRFVYKRFYAVPSGWDRILEFGL
jgi:hypothetical protein